MNPKEIYESLKTEFTDKILAYQEGTGDPFILVETNNIPEIIRFLKTESDFSMDSLMCLSAADTTDKLKVVYHLFSTKHSHKTTLKVNTSKDDPKVPTVSDIHSTANAYEREAYDLFGIKFEGHPNLKRILMPDDWEGHPLRKDYKYPENYHGISCK